MINHSYNTTIFRCYILYYRNWPRYGLRWSGLWCHSRHSTSGAGRRAAACSRAGRPHEPAQTGWAAMLKRPGWQRHCDDQSFYRYSVGIIDKCDVTIASGLHIDDVTIAKLLTFEIISGAARNERYDFRLSKTTWRFNYKWAVVFCHGDNHQSLNSRLWWQIFQVPQNKESAESWIVWEVTS